jgi:acetyl esterase/lipase
VFANLAGLPPILIQVGSTEMLLNDAVRIAENAKAAGVAMQLAIWDDVPHVFTYFSPSIPEVQQGMTQIVDFIQKYLPPSEANSPQNL